MRVDCLWEISRICLSLDGTTMVLMEHPDTSAGTLLHGQVQQGQCDLTLNEAKELLRQLHSKIQQYEQIDASIEVAEKLWTKNQNSTA